MAMPSPVRVFCALLFAAMTTEAYGPAILRKLSQKDPSLNQFLNNIDNIKRNLKALPNDSETTRQLASENEAVMAKMVNQVCKDIENDVNDSGFSDIDVEGIEAADNGEEEGGNEVKAHSKLEDLKYSCECKARNNAETGETVVTATCSNSEKPLCLMGTDHRAFSGKFMAIFDQGLNKDSTVNSVNFCFEYTGEAPGALFPVDATNLPYVGHTSCLRDPLLASSDDADDTSASSSCKASIDGKACRKCVMCDKSTESLQIDCSNLDSVLQEDEIIKSQAASDPLQRVPPPRMIVDECYADDDAQSTAWQWWHPEVEICEDNKKTNDKPALSCLAGTRNLQQNNGNLAKSLNEVLERFYSYKHKDLARYCMSPSMKDGITGAKHSRSLRPAGCVWDFATAHPNLTNNLQKACDKAGGQFYWTGAKLLCEDSDDNDQTTNTGYYGLYNVPNCAAGVCTSSDEFDLQKDFDERVRFTAVGMQEGLYGVVKCSVRQTFFVNGTEIVNDDGLADPIGPSFEDVTAGVCPSVTSTLLSETPIFHNTDASCGCLDNELMDKDMALEKNVLPVTCQSNEISCWRNPKLDASFSGKARMSYILDLSNFSIGQAKAVEHCFEYAGDSSDLNGKRICMELYQPKEKSDTPKCTARINGKKCSACSSCDSSKDSSFLSVDCRNILGKDSDNFVNMCGDEGIESVQGTYLQFYDPKVRVQDTCSDGSNEFKITEGIKDGDVVIDASSDDIQEDIDQTNKDKRNDHDNGDNTDRDDSDADNSDGGSSGSKDEVGSIGGDLNIVGPVPEDGSTDQADFTDGTANDPTPEKAPTSGVSQLPFVAALSAVVALAAML